MRGPSCSGQNVNSICVQVFTKVYMLAREKGNTIAKVGAHFDHTLANVHI